MSSLAFIPRKLSKRPSSASDTAKNARAAPSSTISRPSSQICSEGPIAPLETPSDTNESRSKGKHREQRFIEPEYASLISMSLSDHALWLNGDLRQSIESSSERFVPLSRIVRLSPVFSGLRDAISEVELLKSIRAHLNDQCEVRMVVAAPSKANWYTPDASRVKVVGGGFEIRRKAWAREETLVAHYAGDYWDARTVYIENCPSRHRTLPGIYGMVVDLLASNCARENLSSKNASRIQSITLPPHHLDKPGDPPKCKGFALVTLSSAEDAEFILAAWPWDPTSARHKENPVPSIVQECVKFGFRCLSKREWSKRQDEYLAYRQKLLHEIVAADAEQTGPRSVPPPSVSESTVTESPAIPPPSTAAEPSPASTQPWSPYPLDCLVFVRRVHPQTNKTTLRTLFSVAFKLRAQPPSAAPSDGIDYVDFTKGLDTCYLRLASAKHAQRLVDYFKSHPTVQQDGLDAGSEQDIAGDGTIVLELVQGRKEQLYWEKVPEKVRKQAVEKAITDSPAPDRNGEMEVQEGDGRRRKRRRRG
ncbi:hypothetical protein PUNSTDRAFT_112817 [Punctularia strigosozonata HHB-11173 SS5]|uniref:uncharacterized protein n=1 Tax=Punctularia strigosozonata (strain HHB-11173) TaxID=741275 RepID=UPI0004417057|nr:uncharacterized protein PUNSTDRAFT_112817 [Punctularia strigosozonata HHB-11173 SS5]EIN11043.1 hypothetical protein PUNSTDRAFT_112817 [Punctularia strigosozonata HHB-11173 SS5]